jgi:hypothetical protein
MVKTKLMRALHKKLPETQERDMELVPNGIPRQL